MQPRPKTTSENRAARRAQLRALLSEMLGPATRWASPPPGVSVRAAVILWLLTTAAFALLLFAHGLE